MIADSAARLIMGLFIGDMVLIAKNITIHLLK